MPLGFWRVNITTWSLGAAYIISSLPLEGVRVLFGVGLTLEHVFGFTLPSTSLASL